MTVSGYLALIAVSICLTGTQALGFAPMSATVKVSSGALYDYVVIGEHPKAADGFDNAYDTIWPGNLNADMGEPYISVIIEQPGWSPAMQELRGDTRLPARLQQWQLSVSSSLAKGTPLKLALQGEGDPLPKGVQLRLKVGKGKKETDLEAGAYTLPAPGPGKRTSLVIIVEQP